MRKPLSKLFFQLSCLRGNEYRSRKVHTDHGICCVPRCPAAWKWTRCRVSTWFCLTSLVSPTVASNPFHEATQFRNPVTLSHPIVIVSEIPPCKVALCSRSNQIILFHTFFYKKEDRLTNRKYKYYYNGAGKLE